MGKPLTPEQKTRRREYLRQWRRDHPDLVRSQRQRWDAAHPEARAAINAKTRMRLGPEYFRTRHQTLKQEMVTAYGGQCACCGETEIEFLSLDHVDGGGRRHRLAVGNSRVVRDLRAAGWPQDGYRILCMNCQFGTRYGRTCPHQIAKSA